MGMGIHETGKNSQGSLAVHLRRLGRAAWGEDRFDDRSGKHQVAGLGFVHGTIEEKNVAQDHFVSLLPAGEIGPLLFGEDFQVDAQGFELQL